MWEEPEIIRLNIRHYEALLKLSGCQADYARINALLAEARSQLALAEASGQHVTPSSAAFTTSTSA